MRAQMRSAVPTHVRCLACLALAQALVATALVGQSNDPARLTSVEITNAAPGQMIELRGNSSFDRVSVQLFRDLGVILANMVKGDPTRALADFDRSIELEASFLPARFHRGRTRSDAGNLDGAIEDFETLLDLDPEHSQGIYELGHARYLAGDIDAALIDLARALVLDSGLWRAHNDRGACLLAQDDVDGAIASFTRAIEIQPAAAFVYRNRSVAWDRKGDSEKAEQDRRNADEIESGQESGGADASSAPLQL